MKSSRFVTFHRLLDFPSKSVVAEQVSGVGRLPDCGECFMCLRVLNQRTISRLLTGSVAAFLAKGVGARTAAAAAAAAQPLASRAIPQSGAVASDVAAALPLVLDAPV